MGSVRRALISDADDVARLTVELGYDADGESIARRLSRLLSRTDQEFFVADHEGRVVGWVHVFISEYVELDPFAVIGGLVVGRGHRRSTTMTFENEAQKKSIQRWSRLAIQLNGAAESGRYDHITTAAIANELAHDRIFEFLARELPAQVWNICKLSDVDRHQLAQEWKMMATAYHPEQFHVSRNGLALLVAYVLHMIDIRHAVIPT